MRPARRRGAPALRPGPRALAAVLLASMLAAAAGAQPFDVACPTDEERQVVELVNVERAARGRAPLELDVRLGAAAVRHSEDMADGCFLSHTGSDGSSAGARVAAAGYGPYAGEVAGAGQRSPQEIVNGWMNSSGHYAILMSSSARHIGVGHVTRSPCTLQGYGFRVGDFWTANLGRDAGPPEGEDAHCVDGAPADPPGACNDGLDNDGDGMADFPEDPECDGPEDPSEEPACSDGLDNDGDGLVDHPEDPGCPYAWAPAEDPVCSDGLDNDNDGLTDFPADPQCASPAQLSETDVNCGLGAELVLLLPPFLWLRRQRERGPTSSR